MPFISVSEFWLLACCLLLTSTVNAVLLVDLIETGLLPIQFAIHFSSSQVVNLLLSASVSVQS